MAAACDRAADPRRSPTRAADERRPVAGRSLRTCRRPRRGPGPRPTPSTMSPTQFPTASARHATPSPARRAPHRSGIPMPIGTSARRDVWPRRCRSMAFVATLGSGSPWTVGLCTNRPLAVHLGHHAEYPISESQPWSRAPGTPHVGHRPPSRATAQLAPAARRHDPPARAPRSDHRICRPGLRESPNRSPSRTRHGHDLH